MFFTLLQHRKKDTHSKWNVNVIHMIHALFNVCVCHYYYDTGDVCCRKNDDEPVVVASNSRLLFEIEEEEQHRKIITPNE